jgi:phospholipid N-methyltransferase
MVMNIERKYQPFYTKSVPIVSYMLQNLSLRPGIKVFEPCGGDGVFVDAVLNEEPRTDIDVFELNPDSVALLKDKYSKYLNIRIRESDTLLDSELALFSSIGGFYDRIIANPPYGAWQDYDKRKILKNLYPDLYTKETYALFLYRCIQLLKDKGILVFIIPDTFLSLHMHKSLREYILTSTKIKEISLFSSSFFPNVNFGYADLSIITIEKCCTKDECLNNMFRILTNYSNVDQLVDNSAATVKTHTFTQKDILKNPDYAFLYSDNDNISNAINNSSLRIGDIANCVTGFYSGNDKEFLKAISYEIRNAKKYGLVDKSLINGKYSSMHDIINGIDDKAYFIPIVKGGNLKFLKNDLWFMNWSKNAVEYYKENRKSRFQNSEFYFKTGIGVPMVSSSQITASLIQNKLFDQSIVGIFPKDELYLYYLLAFFNSKTCNLLIRTINPSANNSANYIKKIPFIAPSKRTLANINSMISTIIDEMKLYGKYDHKLEDNINSIFNELYGF